MKHVLLATVLFLSFNVHADNMPYKDGDFSCVTQEEANRYVSDFNINVQSFGGMELCNANTDTKKLFNDLQIIEHGQFATIGDSNVYIHNFVNPANYYQWMKSETRSINRGQDVPYATAYNSGGNFTMQDGWAKLSTLGRVGTVIHEARHTEGYRHIPCTQGTYQGSSVQGCDTNYNYGGSHAIEMEYYANVAVRGTNFHPVYQKMARLMAIARSNIFFNTPVIQSHEAVLALAADRGTAKLFNNGEWVDREVPGVGGRLKRTSYGGVLFDGVQAMSIELYRNSGFSDLVSDTYSYFKLILENKTPIKDFEEFDEGTKRFVVRVTADNKLTPYDFPNGAWGRDVALPTTIVRASTAALGQTQTGLYLVGANGEIYNYKGSTKAITKLNTTWNPDHQEIIVYKGQNLVLLNNGHIMASTATGLQPWSETNETFAGLVTVPVYDGFEVVR